MRPEQAVLLLRTRNCHLAVRSEEVSDLKGMRMWMVVPAIGFD